MRPHRHKHGEYGIVWLFILDKLSAYDFYSEGLVSF
jgi:hypothetical protein